MLIIYTDTMYIIVLQIDQPTSVNLLLSAQNLEEDLPTTMYWDSSINPSTPQKPKLQTPVHVNTDTWYGFKIVGDNLDQDVKPRFMRFDRPTR